MQNTLIAFIWKASRESIAHKTPFGVRRNSAAYSYNRMSGYLPGGVFDAVWQAAEIQIVVDGMTLTVVRGIHLINSATQAHLASEGFIIEQGPFNGAVAAVVENDPWPAGMSEAERDIIRKRIELRKFLRG